MISCDPMRSLSNKWKLFGAPLLTALLASIFLLLILSAFRSELAKPSLIHLDQHIQESVHSYTSVAATALMLTLTWIGSPKILFALVPLLAALFWWRHLRHEAAILLIAMAGSGILNTALKLHFRRIRPQVPWALVQERSFSFPSGHSVYAVVLYGTLAYLAMRYLRHAWQRAAMIVAALLQILGIGLSRIYLGAHYPTDVAAGYFVGCIWLIAVILSDRTYVARRNQTPDTSRS